MKTLLVVCLLGLTLVHAQARLGETKAQIEARYGISKNFSQGLSDREYISSYRVHNLSVTISFLDGISQEEFFCKTDRKTDFRQEEINAFLADNKGNSYWRDTTKPVKIKGKETDGIYCLADNTALAIYVVGDFPHFWVCTKTFDAYKRNTPRKKAR